MRAVHKIQPRLWFVVCGLWSTGYLRVLSCPVLLAGRLTLLFDGLFVVAVVVAVVVVVVVSVFLCCCCFLPWFFFFFFYFFGRSGQGRDHKDRTGVGMGG